MEYLKEIRTWHILVVSWSPCVSPGPCIACCMYERLPLQLQRSLELRSWVLKSFPPGNQWQKKKKVLFQCSNSASNFLQDRGESLISRVHADNLHLGLHCGLPHHEVAYK